MSTENTTGQIRWDIEPPVPPVWPDAPHVRRTDPETSHRAADAAVKRIGTKLAVERALANAGHPVTADEVYRVAHDVLGYRVTPQRVRTVLAEENGGPWVRLDETALSEYGNPAHLWTLAGEA